MNSNISIKNLNLNFRLYHDKGQSLKEFFAGLLKRRGKVKYTEFRALKDLNLEITHGDRIGIVGHNGAGKSTLLKAICGIYHPTEGSVTVNGRIAPLLEIGAGFNVELSGRDNIYLNGAILGYSTSMLKKIEPEIIEFTGLAEFIDTPVKYYSTGMYMRLAFAIATAVHPDILILDELFAGGDAEFIDKALLRMHEFIDSSSIMVFVSHQPDLLKKLCNRVIWIDHGSIVEDGLPEVVINKYLSKHAG
ncbi:ABC transporter ATP-binding protein [Pseudomonas sp. TH08]|uniref:ABC transporter ATP-binding protein n=1 Tax=unclassified Pseudomonas TaxID=196821 RepID=UPI0019140326|nr:MULTISPECIES: ABC transporter ATP-binding protein [unclassified Pseudomonas]MBK5528324.1 ABC transporter ATP-binding protein [Pseudomonas sp. TH06]MBK5533002.1 ABC transporter ATP-binding protein [Pseudomonas sp. TH08]